MVTGMLPLTYENPTHVVLYIRLFLKYAPADSPDRSTVTNGSGQRNGVYYMASSVSGQDEPNPAL